MITEISLNNDRPVIAIQMDECANTGVSRLCPRWEEKIREFDADVLEIDPKITDENYLRSLLSRVDGILLTGGDSNMRAETYEEEDKPLEDIFRGEPPKFPFSPNRDRLSRFLVHHAIDNDLPLLGVCRGFQELNVALGGAIEQTLKGHDHGYLKERWAAAHRIEVLEGRLSKIFGLKGLVWQNSVHRQGVLVSDLAPGLHIDALDEAGKVVEAISLPGKDIFGVQFHAESGEANPLNGLVFKELVDMAVFRHAKRAYGQELDPIYGMAAE